MREKHSTTLCNAMALATGPTSCPACHPPPPCPSCYLIGRSETAFNGKNPRLRFAFNWNERRTVAAAAQKAWKRNAQRKANITERRGRQREKKRERGKGGKSGNQGNHLDIEPPLPLPPVGCEMKSEIDAVLRSTSFPSFQQCLISGTAFSSLATGLSVTRLVPQASSLMPHALCHVPGMPRAPTKPHPVAGCLFDLVLAALLCCCFVFLLLSSFFLPYCFPLQLMCQSQSRQLFFCYCFFFFVLAISFLLSFASW